jgi:hypothetical protein
MGIWPEDFTKSTLAEVVGMQAENTASSKNVRLKTKAIVDSKLAGEISKEQYLAGRKLASEEAAECKRRRTVLITELAARGYQCNEIA